MPRHARIEGVGLVHHVTGRSFPELDAFPDDEAKRGFLALVSQTVRSLGWEVLAYAILTNHHHLLLRTPAPNLGDGMRWIHGRHAQLLNARLGRNGPVWGDRFHNRVVRTGRHVLRAAAYIDANPVEAGLCTDPLAFAWSSCRANAGLAPGPAWHRPDLLYRFVGAPADEAGSVYRAVVERRARAHLERRAGGLSPAGDCPP